METGPNLRSFIFAVCTLRDICIGGLKSVHQKGKITAEDLVERLKIPIDIAKKTLWATTQLAVGMVDEPSLTRKFQTKNQMLQYPWLSTDTFMDTFSWSKEASPLRCGFTMCQVFATKFGHVFMVLMEGKSGIKIADTLKRLMSLFIWYVTKPVNKSGEIQGSYLRKLGA